MALVRILVLSSILLCASSTSNWHANSEDFNNKHATALWAEGGHTFWPFSSTSEGGDELWGLPSTSSPIPGEMDFTILVNAYKRDVCLKEVLEHWLTCKPTQLRVIWNDYEREVPQDMQDMATQSVGVLVFDKMKTAAISNRFKVQQFLTDALFSVDDDITFPCEEVSAAYRVWQTHQSQMVGFSPRQLDGNGITMAKGGKKWIAGYDPVKSYAPWGQNTANALFVTRGGFLHKRFYQEFWSTEYESHRKWVDEHTTGEDILMSFVVGTSIHGGLKPVPVLVAEHKDLSAECMKEPEAEGALSKRKDSNKNRAEFIKNLFKKYPKLEVASLEDFFYYDSEDRVCKIISGTCGAKAKIPDKSWQECISRIQSKLPMGLSGMQVLIPDGPSSEHKRLIRKM